MKSQATLLRNAKIVNEGHVVSGDILIEDGLIKKIASSLTLNT